MPELMSDKKLKIGLVQYSPVWNNKRKTADKLHLLIEKHVSDEDLLIFPEMSLTGFSMDSKKNAEEIDGFSFDFFINLASKLKKHLIAGIVTENNNRIFNSAVHFNPQGIITAQYHKIHLFSLAEEDKHFQAGFEPIISKINDWKIGFSICYDLRFPELYRKYAKQTTDLIINIASWPEKRINHWESLLKARAIENQCYVAAVNRIGSDPYHNYPGASSIFDPSGNLIIFNNDSETIISVEIELQNVSSIREKLNFLSDIKLI